MSFLIHQLFVSIMQLMCAWLFWKISRQVCEQYATYDFEPKIAKYNSTFYQWNVRNLHALKNWKHLAYPNFKQIDLSKKLYIKNSICNALM